MSMSPLQEPFLRELAETFVATRRRISKRLAEAEPLDTKSREEILRDELRGLYHGVLVAFDGGTPLADEGLIRIVDESGFEFDRFLHEIAFSYWPSAD